MLPLVKTPTQKIEKYQELISKELFREILKLSKELKGLKVFHVNSAPRGGGVAELLKSLVPLMKGVGLKASWYVNPPGEKFFTLTKTMHNALQGEEFEFPFFARRLYIRHMELTAKLMQDMKPDLWVIHDPQPVGAAAYLPNFHPAVWRVHIDTSNPNKEAYGFIYPFMTMYDKVVFTCKDFIGPSIPKKKILIFPPAIDPLMQKNIPLSLKEAKIILQNFNINLSKPLVTQVARFDPWKDPLGVVEAYQLAKKKIPDLQLALLGLFLARDDPQGVKIYNEEKKKVKGDPDIFLFSDPEFLGSLRVDTFVNAFQVASDVIIHKAVREGFGLSVAEAMWKGKPVIGGNVGGIKLQIKNGVNGFLVNNSKQAGQRIVQLIKNPGLSEKMGRRAKESVREKFLMPRLLRDHLKLYKEMLNI